MPSITTHNIFAKEVYKALNSRSKEVINGEINTYEMFAQSFDWFYFYNLRDFKNGRKYRKLAGYCHKSNTQLYLINIVKNIIKNNLQQNPQVISYLYGTITHYCLDSICHPFIFYKTGIYNKNNNSTKKYKGLHTKMEKNIDAYFYEKYYQKPFYKYNIVKDILPRIRLKDDTKTLINTIYEETYNKANIANILIKSYNNSRLIYRLTTYDKRGIKKRIYSLLDRLLPYKKSNYANWSYYIKQIEENYLNLENKTWCHPCDDNIISNDSFIDLFDKAKKKALVIINEVNKTIYDNADISNLLDVIPNVSYFSGMLITDKKLMSFFEF
ncbi:MAG TPA: zinc dependent phospholipase C family protein [Bacilli bacterium]|nr:zinc dependent phospholipase C family protein [Bacilli bacterium]